MGCGLDDSHLCPSKLGLVSHHNIHNCCGLTKASTHGNSGSLARSKEVGA